MNDTVEKQILGLLRQSLAGEDKDVSWLTDEIWEQMRTELEHQTVSCIPADLVMESGISDKNKEILEKRIGINFFHFFSLMRQQKEICGFLQEAGIPVVVLKGAAAAEAYPQPALRAMGDIDLLVEPENFERAYHLFIEKGYYADSSLEDFYRHAAFRNESGAEVELHEFFLDNLRRNKAEIGNRIIADAIKNLEIKEVEGYPVPMLPAAENGLVLLGHIKHHLAGGLGLRQILDWMCFVDKYLDDEMWNTRFKGLAETIGLRNLAETTTLMCQKYLGLSDRITWCKGANEGLVDEMLSYLFKKGNFGKKKSYYTNSVTKVLFQAKNPLNFFAFLQRCGMVNWKAAKNHKILRPFAWIYEIGHLIRRGIHREGGLSGMAKDLWGSQKDVNLLERLISDQETDS